MAEVFLCETGQLDAASRRELKRAGVTVVEVADPSKCQFIRATEVVSADDMLWAALDALRRDFGSYSKGERQREQFTVNIWELMRAARGAEPGKEQGRG